ncbi:MAG: HIT family hydrolase [Candidatus Cloacimonetes bacterium HGW-Cloacimonetes-3]|nr:MAG: HIT family hydrolase [Candidatus Cloacimonetes bacterium HGW-Cloacimonetes-3]
MSKPEDPRYLYSPWRMDYILGEKADDCVMCRYQQLGSDEENLILHRAEFCYVMLNRYPYNNGHLMIIPYVHISCLSDLDLDTWIEMSHMIRSTERILREQYKCDGINIGLNLGCAAGAGIADHLHVHLVPRWAGDSNFMSVICGERVIPESFESAYSRLRPEFAKLHNIKE